MKKIVIAALVLAFASGPAAAYSSNKGMDQTWGLCETDFPGLGFFGHIFVLPCRVTQTPSNA